MPRFGIRLAMAAVGLLLLAGYLAAASLGYLGLRWLWAARPTLPALLAVLIVVSIGSAYLSYRIGTVQLLAGLEADRLPRERAPSVHRRLDELALRMDVERPDLFVTAMHAPNALAVGGTARGAMVLDRSLFVLLDPVELEGIMAHELAHLEGNDGLQQAVTYGIGQTIVGLLTVVCLPAILALSGLARGSAWLRGTPFDRRGPFARLYRALVGAIVVVLVAFTLLGRARSRRREFDADDRAAEVTGDPLALARALRKIERAQGPAWELASLSTNRDTEDPLERWIATHPSTEERVERLLERAGSTQQQRRAAGPTYVPVE